MSNVATDVIVRVRMEFGAASETRRAAEAALAVQRAVETAQLTTLAKVRSAHKPAINDQIADVRKLEQAYTQMASRVVASFEQIRRAAGGGGGGLVFVSCQALTSAVMQPMFGKTGSNTDTFMDAFFWLGFLVGLQ